MKLLFIALLILPFVSFSQDWTYLASSSNTGELYYYKKHTEDISYKKIWIKQVGGKLRRTGKNKKLITFSGYNLILYNINCSDRSYATIKVSHFSSNGTFLGSIEANEFDFSYPNPDSIGESIVEAACDQ